MSPIDHDIQANPQQIAIVFIAQSDRGTYHRIVHLISAAADVWQYAEMEIEEFLKIGFIVQRWYVKHIKGNYYG